MAGFAGGHQNAGMEGGLNFPSEIQALAAIGVGGMVGLIAWDLNHPNPINPNTSNAGVIKLSLTNTEVFKIPSLNRNWLTVSGGVISITISNIPKELQ